jgi:hypothetical protein
VLEYLWIVLGVLTFARIIFFLGAATVFWSIDLPSPGGADPILEWALQMANTDNRTPSSYISFILILKYCA